MSWFSGVINGLLSGLVIYEHNEFIHFLDSKNGLIKIYKWNIIQPVDCYQLSFENPDDTVIPELIEVASWAGHGMYFNNIFLMPEIAINNGKELITLIAPFCDRSNNILGRLKIVVARHYNPYTDLPEEVFTNLNDPWHRKMFYDA